MKVNLIDCIADDKPHCGNCDHWHDNGELFAQCEKKNEECPSFAVCDSWCIKLLYYEVTWNQLGTNLFQIGTGCIMKQHHFVEVTKLLLQVEGCKK